MKESDGRLIVQLSTRIGDSLAAIKAILDNKERLTKEEIIETLELLQERIKEID